MLLTLGIGSAWAEEYALYSGTITEGDYVIVYDGNAMNNTVSSSRFGYTAVTITGDKISNPPATIVWHIAPSGDYWTIFSADVNKYAASTGAKNKAQLLASGTDDKSLWTVSGSSTYEFVNKANAAANVNKNLRQNGTYGFACYATSTGGALSLYKKVEQSGGGETPEPTPDPEEPDPTPGAGSSTGWVETAIANIASSDLVVVTMTNSSGTYAMSNDNGTGAAPAAVSVTVNGDKLAAEPADNLKWNITYSSGNLTIYPNGDNAKWLYCTATNNGTRVGTNADKIFTIDATSGYLKNTATTRYLGVYNNQDWRCYTSTTTNIANQTLKFYKYVEPTGGGSEPETPTPFVSVSPASHTFATTNVGETATQVFEITAENTTETLSAEISNTTDYAISAIADNKITVTYQPQTAETHEATLTIKAGEEASTTVALTGKAKTPLAPIAGGVIDILNQDWTDVTGTNYTDVAAKTAENEGHSNAQYVAQCAGDKSSIQLRSNNSNSGVVSTISGGVVKRIEVEWHADTDAARTLQIYGSNTAYTAATDLYGDAKGELLGELNKGEGETTLDFSEWTGDYKYIGFRSKSGAMYLTTVTITWLPTISKVTIADPIENGSISVSGAADLNSVAAGTELTLSNTPSADYKLSAYDVYKTGDETTKVTVTSGKFVMPEFDVTISATFVPAKTLTSIEITNAATQTTFWQGETFNHTGLEVTAHFNGAADEVVTPTVTGSTATAGTQTVTVSYTEGTTTKTATYTITVKDIPNTKETAYSVADAYDIIDKLTTASGVFISGIISQVDSYNSTYKSITYWISADGTTTKQLQVYSGKGLESADFSAVTDIARGAQVIVCGNLKKHNSTYEFDYNNYLVEYTAPTKNPAGLEYATTEYTANVNEAFAAPTLTNPNGLTVTYSTSDATLATVNATTGAVTILDKTGKVTITATFAGNESYLYGTASFNITISDPSLTEVTFDATVDLGNTTKGEGSIAKSPITFACTDGVLGNGSEYRLYKDATISFTAENGYAITKVVITSTASGTSQYGPSHLSTENGTYSVSDKTGTWVGEAQTVTFTATAQSRAKLITVYYKTDNRQDAGLVWSTENVSITLGDAFTAPTLSNPNGLTLTCTSDNENLATVTNAGVVTLKSSVTGKATITAKFDGNSDYKDATVTCTITVNPKTETVVILAQYGDQWYALKNVEETEEKVLAALPVNYVGGKLYNVADADKATIEWQRAAVTDGIIFKNGENYIYGTAGSTDLKLSTTECAWTLDGTTYKLGNRTFFYNETANGFKNYSTSNAGNSGYSNLPVVTAPVYVNLNTSSVKTVENGIFSVADDKFVQFSAGNLQYNVGTNAWSFATNQYDYVGDANINVGDPTFTGTIDMFGWSADGKFGVNPSNKNEDYYGTFQDWGDLVNEADWYTLSADEWKYLLNTRANAANLKQIAKVNNGEKDIVGIMLFPDAWTMPADVNVAAENDDYFKVNIYNYTLDQWTKLEEAGAVFLPAAGRRAGGYGNMINKEQVEETNSENLNGGHYKHYDNGNIYCYYWTSTINESTKNVSYLHNIQALGNDEYTIGTGAIWGEKGRYGQSVRLVKAVEHYKRTDMLGAGVLGTICLPHNVPAGHAFGATFYTVLHKTANSVVFEEVKDGLKAGKPYLFQAEGDVIYCFYGDETVSEPTPYNGMYGTFSDIELTELTDVYYFAQKALWSCTDLTSLSIPANRAYLKMDKVPTSAPAPAPGVRRISLGVNGQNTATGIENVGATEQPMKMIIDGQLYILRGEKMYDAQGKLVK